MLVYGICFVVKYLDFHSIKRALWLVDSLSRASDQIKMYPDWDIIIISNNSAIIALLLLHTEYNSTWLFKGRSKYVTKHLMCGHKGNWLVLFSFKSWCFLRWSRGKHQDSRENKSNCFPQDHILGVYFLPHLVLVLSSVLDVPQSRRKVMYFLLVFF